MKKTWSIELLLEVDGRRLFSAHWGTFNEVWLNWLEHEDFVVFSDVSMPGPAIQIKRILRDFNLERFIFLCNDPDVYIDRLNNGLKAIFINQNAFIDEEIFRPDLSSKKKYDAIYNARLRPVKRHYLASEIEPNYKLALITGYHTPGLDSISEEDIPRHSFKNSYQFQSSTVARLLNESRVGLIFSEAEGACFASSEYLLCGLPVLSTQSSGGRKFWYNDYNSIICNDSSDAVLDGLERLLKEPRDPFLIREDHLKKMYQHRQKFISDVVKFVFPFLGSDFYYDLLLDRIDFRRYLAFQKKESWKKISEIESFLDKRIDEGNFKPGWIL